MGRHFSTPPTSHRKQLKATPSRFMRWLSWQFLVGDVSFHGDFLRRALL